MQLSNASHLFWEKAGTVKIQEALTHLINFNPDLLDLSSVPWNSVESISLKIFLLRLKLLYRLPHKRWNLDDLPCSCTALEEMKMH